MSWYLGVDAGGSYTRAVVFNPENGIFAEGHGGIGNPYAIDPAIAFDSIERAVANALGQVACHAYEVSSACLGVAGVARQGTPDGWMGAFSDWGVGQIEVVSDLEIAHYASFRGGAGIHVIAGTGSSVLIKNLSGESRVFGGWGWLLGDEGSASEIGKLGIQWLCRQIDHSGHSAPLAQSIMDSLEISQTAEIVPRIYRDPNLRQVFAVIAPIVTRLAGDGDPHARQIVDTAATSLATLVHQAVMSVEKMPEIIPLATSGGVFRADSFSRSFQAALGHAHRSFRYISSRGSALGGALARALGPEMMNLPAVESLVETI